ncbi:hypothetical protein Fleli_1521 [Bernardetia litoralis DSM 6794]|uniref:Uncharacterized protein n=1 Tax=Bernardetia litoralis (strain ATCC 23117 / DSM 6794 / NBRC 15988 / NCIMB 1366 / Fx l1 / Sio-4) TaxID=880071 RepID=I4AJ08_BERLS|nr:hypothetical protein [Bernardetia litoralis]AFM03943.1 hypothetical protein Fleli_1521 [Bernardetia litoralis DSM 6794]
MAQNLTFEEAKEMTHQLYEIELLSEKGEKYLLQEIEKNLLENKNDSVEKSFILEFLYTAFDMESWYRGGTLTQREYKKYQEIMTEIPQDGSFSEDDEKMIIERLENEFGISEARKIEEAIKNEEEEIKVNDSLGGYVIYPPLYLKEEVIKNIHKNRSTFGKTRTRTLNDLLKISLIDSLVFEEIYKQFKKGELSTEGYICSAALNKVEYYQNFENEKNKQIELINKLEKGNVISQSNKEKLINSYQKWELKKLYEFIPFCTNAKTFNLKEYPNDVEKAYKAIFEEIKEIVPAFDFQNFKIDLVIEKSNYGGADSQNLIISFDVDSVHYTHSVFYNYLSKNEKLDYTLKIAHNFHKVINKFLSDQNSKKRLYFAEKTNNPNRDENEFGLILLTEKQRYLWKNKIKRVGFSDVELTGYDYYDMESSFLSTEIHNNRFNTKNIEKIIAEYEKIGLFSHLSKEEFKEGLIKVKQNEIKNYTDILLSFPKQIAFVGWEKDNLEDPYGGLTEEFGEISRGKFTPQNIKEYLWDRFEGRIQTSYYTFDFNDKTYHPDLIVENDWATPYFLELIKLALKENKINEKFYVCIDDTDSTGYIFLSNSQYKFLNKNQPELFPKHP